VRPPVPANRGLKLRCLDRAIAVLEGTPRAIDARLAKAEYAVDSYSASPMEWPVDLDAARKAVDAMTRAKEDGPRLARGRLVLGKSLRLSGNAVDARAVLAALRAMPDDSRAAVDADAALELGEAWVATNEGGALDRGLEIWRRNSRARGTPHAPRSCAVAWRTSCSSRRPASPAAGVVAFARRRGCRRRSSRRRGLGALPRDVRPQGVAALG
jgi:hypothetical protein